VQIEGDYLSSAEDTTEIRSRFQLFFPQENCFSLISLSFNISIKLKSSRTTETISSLIIFLDEDLPHATAESVNLAPSN
jgi:hypothetical protein